MSNAKPPILLLSKPGMGKTFSLKNIKPELGNRTLLINCDSKPLSWVGNTAFKVYSAPCPTLIPAIIKKAGDSGDFDLIIVDTITVAMAEYTRRFINTEMPKYAFNKDDQIVSDRNYVSTSAKLGGIVDSMANWGKYAALVSEIVAEGSKCKAQFVMMGHLNSREDEGGEFIYKCPLQGQIGKQGLEGLFSIVMHATTLPLEKLTGEYNQEHKYLGTEESLEFTGERFVFQVAHTKDTIHSHALRTIQGLWPDGVRFIDNDLQMVFDRFDEVYKA